MKPHSMDGMHVKTPPRLRSENKKQPQSLPHEASSETKLSPVVDAKVQRKTVPLLDSLVIQCFFGAVSSNLSLSLRHRLRLARVGGRVVTCQNGPRELLGTSHGREEAPRQKRGSPPPPSEDDGGHHGLLRGWRSRWDRSCVNRHDAGLCEVQRIIGNIPCS